MQHVSDTVAPDGLSAGAESPLILAFGDSLTAGYGLARDESFPARLQALLRPHHPDARVENAGVSGDTTASALARLPRVLARLRSRPDLAIVEFGANDLIRRLPVDRTRANLDAILVELARCGIPVLLAAMEAPRFLGPLATRCDAVYADLAARHGVPLVPFFPAGVMGASGLTLRDGLHPNAQAIALVARYLLPTVLAALDRSRAAAA